VQVSLAPAAPSSALCTPALFLLSRHHRAALTCVALMRLVFHSAAGAWHYLDGIVNVDLLARLLPPIPGPESNGATSGDEYERRPCILHSCEHDPGEARAFGGEGHDVESAQAGAASRPQGAIRTSIAAPAGRSNTDATGTAVRRFKPVSSAHMVVCSPAPPLCLQSSSSAGSSKHAALVVRVESVLQSSLA
jgi:hypothetical protein